MNEIFDGKFGKAENLLIVEFLEGEEMSYFIVSDGKNIKSFQTAQDHKRALEGDKGKNTGGMGAYSPSRLLNDELENKIINKKSCKIFKKNSTLCRDHKKRKSRERDPGSFVQWPRVLNFSFSFGPISKKILSKFTTSQK